MPAIPDSILSASATSLIAFLTSRHADPSLNSTSGTAAPAGEHGLQVVCAWPVSGQYGPGSRALYYILIAACVLARKADWIRNAALAAALIFPAVAAIHGIVLAAVHSDGAVDMDVYGAFQLCSIGILAAPVTVRLSRTYFNDPGRNTIFLWTGLLVAGLMSLTVEFYRITPATCILHHPDGSPITHASDFPYKQNPSCGLVCPSTSNSSPLSPIRGGSNDQHYVIPAPDRFTFGAATLLSAGCCVHAILWMVAMLVKVLETSFNKTPFGGEDVGMDEPIEGTNGATKGKMTSVNDRIRLYLSIAVIPIFGGAGLIILVIGEINFFSRQVYYQTEPMTSIGQWAPMVGTAFATLGSLYLLLVADVEAVRANLPSSPSPPTPCVCTCCNHLQQSHSQSHLPHPRRSQSPSTSHPSSSSPSPSRLSSHHNHSHDNDEQHVTTTRTRDTFRSLESADAGNRRRVAEMFLIVGAKLGHATENWAQDDSKFRVGPVEDYPLVPGEDLRNSELKKTQEKYNAPRSDAGGDAAAAAAGGVGGTGGTRSRAESFLSVASGISHGDVSSPGEPSSPSPRHGRLHANTFPSVRGTGVELSRITSVPADGPLRGRPSMRRGDMLEVPGSGSGHRHRRTASGASGGVEEEVAVDDGEGARTEREDESPTGGRSR